MHDLAVVMASRGHEVTVVTRAPGWRSSSRHQEGVEISYRPRHRWAPRLVGLNSLEAFAVTAASAALRDDVDVCHAFYLTDAYGLHLAARVRPRPLVFSWHGLPNAAWWETNLRKTHRWYLRALRAGAVVSVMTERSVAPFVADYGSEPVVLTPGIFVSDYSAPKRKPDHPTVVCAAALDDGRKRMDLLIAAFDRLAGEQKDARLRLIGDGDPAEVARLAGGLSADVRRRISWNPTTDVAAVYAESTVGVLTSFNEAYGLVAAEYLASGMPAVVSDDGGTREIVTEETGYAFRVGDAEDCADKLRQALALAANPGTEERCRARAQAFDWTTRADAYERLYLSLAGTVGSRSPVAGG